MGSWRQAPWSCHGGTTEPCPAPPASRLFPPSFAGSMRRAGPRHGGWRAGRGEPGPRWRLWGRTGSPLTSFLLLKELCNQLQSTECPFPLCAMVRPAGSSMAALTGKKQGKAACPFSGVSAAWGLTETHTSSALTCVNTEVLFYFKNILCTLTWRLPQSDWLQLN